jgi:hypothetical protein
MKSSASLARNFSSYQTSISYVNSSIKLNLNQSGNVNLKPLKWCVFWIYVMLFQISDTFHKVFRVRLPYLLLIRSVDYFLTVSIIYVERLSGIERQRKICFMFCNLEVRIHFTLKSVFLFNNRDGQCAMFELDFTCHVWRILNCIQYVCVSYWRGLVVVRSCHYLWAVPPICTPVTTCR